MNGEGKFIVLEGIDGSGLTTHSRRLFRWLDGTGQLAVATQEPSDGTLGSFIRRALNHQLKFDAKTLALLFAADRADHLHTTIEPQLAQGLHVVCDRYCMSSYAYQSLEQELDWVMEINRGCRQPDLTLFLDVPASVCWERIRTVRSHRELFEYRETLESVRQNFHRVIERLRREGENILVIAGIANGHARSISEIGREVQKATKELLRL